MTGETAQGAAGVELKEGKKFYPVGSKVWHCVQTTEDMGLAILCTVVDAHIVESKGAMIGDFPVSTPRTINTPEEAVEADAAGCIIFYDLDEPIGHTVTEDELCEKREGFAVTETSDEYYTPNKEETLGGWREECIQFIKSTHGPFYGRVCLNDCCKMPYDEWVKMAFPDLRDKKEGEEWFRISC